MVKTVCSLLIIQQVHYVLSFIHTNAANSLHKNNCHKLCDNVGVLHTRVSNSTENCIKHTCTTTTTIVLQPLYIYRLSCIHRHLQSKTGGFFCWCKVLLPACPCWWQPPHSYAAVLLNKVIYTVFVSYKHTVFQKTSTFSFLNNSVKN